ncbi:hypothetical protein BDQ17DRAFT_522882 [Cyathus striatus]|nr:hypothetical protein BDQ17DRAFT_522882 [Cyathus striatus]
MHQWQVSPSILFPTFPATSQLYSSIASSHLVDGHGLFYPTVSTASLLPISHSPLVPLQCHCSRVHCLLPPPLAHHVNMYYPRQALLPPPLRCNDNLAAGDNGVIQPPFSPPLHHDDNISSSSKHGVDTCPIGNNGVNTSSSSSPSPSLFPRVKAMTRPSMSSQCTPTTAISHNRHRQL